MGSAKETERPSAQVDVISVRLRFGNHQVFDGLSCRLSAGRITVILGASGVGKSTLLRLLGRLEKPDYGDIWVGDDEITSMTERRVRRLRRRVGMMFQHGALMDSMTVFDNLALPLREHTRLDESDIADRVHQQFAAVGLRNVDHLLPGEASGGMKKRIALARAMITEPDILLCDEPFSGLDPPAVRLIEALLLETNRRTGVTMIVTNHHIGSTMRIADDVVFLIDGSAICGPTQEIRKSADPRLVGFLEAAAPGPLPQERSAQ